MKSYGEETTKILCGLVVHHNVVKPVSILFAMTTVEQGFGIIGARRTLVAPYDPEPASWTNLEWIDYATGQTHPISTDLTAPSALDRLPG
jgi:hypothetical protein